MAERRPRGLTCPACGFTTLFVPDDDGAWVLDGEWWHDRDIDYADSYACLRRLRLHASSDERRNLGT